MTYLGTGSNWRYDLEINKEENRVKEEGLNSILEELTILAEQEEDESAKDKNPDI